jgi:hypothetical protein
MTTRGGLLRLLLAASLAFVGTPAIAQMTKDQCLEVNTQAQLLRRKGQLAMARAQLQRCGDPACPVLVRDDCTRMTEELERAQPTIVFDAKDGAGRDLVAVKVAVDGQPLTDRLEGAPLRVDPGAHAFTFTAEGQPPVTQTFVLKEGEKDRRERVTIGGPASAAAPIPPVSPPSPAGLPPNPPEAATAEGLGTRRILGLALGGAGVAGLALGGVFGLMTASAANQQKTDCASASSCANYAAAASDHTNAQTDGTISTIAFVAGGALLVGGAVLWFLPSHSAEPATAASLVVAPAVGPGGLGLSLRGGF